MKLCHSNESQLTFQLADREKIEIRSYNVIYDALDDLKNARA